MKEATRQKIREQISQISHGIETTFGVKAQLDYDDNYPVLYNNPKFTEAIIKELKQAQIPQVTQITDFGPQDPSEDFAYFAQKKPSSFLYVGCMTDDGANHPHHSPDFLMNEKCLLIAAKAAGTATVSYLSDFDK